MLTPAMFWLFREGWNYLFGPPGWKPNGQGSTTEDLRRAVLAGAD